jgi:DNA replication protein DnaC
MFLSSMSSLQCITICVALQISVNHWHDYIGDPTLADAILDRIVHRSHRIHLESKESMRKRETTKESAKIKDRDEE